MAHRTLVGKFLIWRVRHLNDRYFVIIISAVIGFTAGIAAYLLKTSVFYIEHLLTGKFGVSNWNYLYVVYPVIGILLTILFVKYILRDNVKHGIPRILFVISRHKGIMKRHKTFSSIIGASLTAGFGGSIGLEAPIISTGSSIGSSLGQLLRLNYRTRILLIGCGAAGAIASIFTTPVAAVIFGLEVLMLDLTTSSIIPLLMASVTGAITTKLLMAEKILFHFKIVENFTISDVPFFILLGIITGLISLYFNKMNYFVRGKMERINNTYTRFIIGAISLGILIAIFPPLYGEGYDAIKLILTGNTDALLSNSVFYSIRDNIWVVVLFVFFLMVFKVIATTLTIESGGIGGIFAPSAVMGGFAGFIFARLVNNLHVSKHLSESNFTLVGMAGVLGGVLHAPLTAIFLVAELTHGYVLIVPLMLTTTLSFLTIKIFDPHSIFTKRLAERGELLTHHKDQTVLTLLKVQQVVDKDIISIYPDDNLGSLVKVISKSKRNLFPVVSKDNIFLGLVILDDVREDMFVPNKYQTPVAHYIIQPSENQKISVNEPMDSVMEKFKRTGNYNIVVLDKGKYVGFVSRANIFSAYRKTLIDVSHE